MSRYSTAGEKPGARKKMELLERRLIKGGADPNYAYSKAREIARKNDTAKSNPRHRKR